MVILLDLGTSTLSLCRIPQSIVIQSKIRTSQIQGLLETWLFLRVWWFVFLFFFTLEVWIFFLSANTLPLLI